MDIGKIIIDQRQRSSVMIVRLGKTLDVYTSPYLEEELLKIIGNGHRNLILDFSDVEHIASAGFGVLIGILRAIERQQGMLVLCHIDKNISEIFRLLGFDQIFDIVRDEDHAVKRMGHG